MTHELKIAPAAFGAVTSGKKRAEYRLNDRDFKEGDQLHLREYDAKCDEYSGWDAAALVTHVATGPELPMIPDGYAVLSFELIRHWERGEVRG